jgi:GTPase
LKSIIKQEKALLVSIDFDNKDSLPQSESILELGQLAKTAGATVVGNIIQKRSDPDMRFFIGKGKLEELKALCELEKANLIIFDHELSPSQNRNLEDIFSQHAHSKEGALQVELAQLKFNLTRLTGFGTSLSRLGGGIGTRGPGETKLEMDRRRINKRISWLKEEIEKIRAHRKLRREKRKAASLPMVAIIGYTNAGKSTLLNALTNSEVEVRDQLFATLDPTTLRLRLPSGKNILISDTVGFIRKLPHQLVEAFHATLEEVVEADLLLHLVDISHTYYNNQIYAVYNVLEELHAISKPIITVFNKSDKLFNKNEINLAIKKYDPAVEISALNKTNFNSLLNLISKKL